MKYNVTVNESNLVLSADNSKTFFEEFAKLPNGEYTVTVLSDESRSGKHQRQMLTNRELTTINMVFEVIAILLALACVIPLWIIGCALI